MKNNVLLISSPDSTGLVHHITGALYRRGLNILSNGEFVDHGSGTFFMRTEFQGEVQDGGLTTELHEILPQAQIQLFDGSPKNVVLFASKEHHCLGDLLMRHSYGELNAKILAVVANHETLEPLVRKFHIPFHFVPHNDITREEHEARLLKVAAEYNPEYLVLAKFMRVLTPAFVARFNNRIVNIHHSFLPAFIGSSPYRQAYERGVKIIGATAHFVNNNLDEGPIVTQGVIPVDHTHSAADMAQAGRDVEKVVLANALKLVFENRVIVHGNKTVIL